MQPAYESDSASSLSDEVSMNIASYPAPSDPSYPRFPPPPPTASVRDDVASEPPPRARPLEALPPVVVAPSVLLPPPVPSPGPDSPRAGAAAAGKSKRKTILERIEGWWDLGLLEKRQTLFGGGNKLSAPR
ncbi:hypothetical protein JDV02_009156 [Purpureocillium takamizusanense]|uniref:Uncharacterized protein n=1 Tax=Purpureocillium takamizusanense TaxID=2060973 RepID=A0A9Q8VFZ9_9HYPO|nr:uncharacterized protein JDV02_009156 [Purpureocillium takamizusanense]UNI23327.1 hypothetical protein JDV02_009156 [Purpureocillium takamizusanense]